MRMYLDIETTGLSPYSERVTCIGFAFDGKEPKGLASNDERNVLETFAKACKGKRLEVFTWGGRYFDVPFLRVRYLKHGLEMPAFNVHVDLKDAFPEFRVFGKHVRPSLGQAAEFLDLPLRKNGDGKHAIALFKKNALFSLIAYCVNDVKLVRAVHERVGGNANVHH